MPLWLKNNSATMVCPFLWVVMIPSGFRGGVGVSLFSVNGSLLSLGAEKGFPVIGKSLSAVGYSVLLCGGGGLRLFSRSVFPRFDTVILPLLFNVFGAVGSGIFPVVGAALFLFRFFDFLPHFFDFLFCRLGKLCQFVLKPADMVLSARTEMHKPPHGNFIQVCHKPLSGLYLWEYRNHPEKS